MSIENSNEILEKRMCKSIEDYLKTTDEFSIVIDGPWGTGKTFYFKEWIKKRSDEKKSMIISLYGLTSVNDLKEKISGYNIDEDDIKNAKLTTALIDQLTSNNNDEDKKNGNFITSVIEANKHLKVLSSVAQIGVNVINNNLLKNKINKTDIFIFDDFERCDSVVLDEIVPYITNNLIIENKKRVIYLSDLSKYKNKLLDKKKPLSYMNIPIFEKNIKEIIHFKTSLSTLQEKIFNTIFQENSTFSFNSISKIYKNETNLRHLKRQWTFLSDIITSEEFQKHDYVKNYEEDLFKKIAKNICNSKLLGMNNDENIFDHYKSHDISLNTYVDRLANSHDPNKNYLEKLENLEYYYKNPDKLNIDIHESISELFSELKNPSDISESLLYNSFEYFKLYSEYIENKYITIDLLKNNNTLIALLTSLTEEVENSDDVRDSIYLQIFSNLASKLGMSSKSNSRNLLANTIEKFVLDPYQANFGKSETNKFFLTKQGNSELNSIYIYDISFNNQEKISFKEWKKNRLIPILEETLFDENFFISNDVLYKTHCITLAANVGITIQFFENALDNFKTKNQNNHSLNHDLKNKILTKNYEEIYSYYENTIIDL